jgi:hypothetical protein
MSNDEGIVTVHPQKDNTETSLAAILQSQFIERSMEPVLKSTEVRDSEVMGYAGMMMSQFVNEIIGCTKRELEGASNIEEANYIKRKLALKKQILSDPNNMVWLMENTWTRFFGILRQSLNRQSRKEGTEIACATVQRQAESDQLNIGQRFLAKIGIGKYRVGNYREKE